jgi:hypothetical protein
VTNNEPVARKETPLHRADAASLKATAKSTPVDADGQGNTNELIRIAPRIQNNPGWTSGDVLHRKFVELQNRWSALGDVDGRIVPVAPPPAFEFAE